MFTEQALQKAKIDLYNIISNHAMNDYKQANFTRTRKSYKHIPYSIGYDTRQAKEIYDLVYGKNPEDITAEQEEQIKAFLLIYRMNRTEYLQDKVDHPELNFMDDEEITDIINYANKCR